MGRLKMMVILFNIFFTGFSNVNATQNVLSDEKINLERIVLTESDEVVTGWINLDGVMQYIKPDGTKAIGFEEIDGKYYYFNTEGILQTGWIEVDNQKYYAQLDGQLVTGIVQIDNNYYYFNPEGILQTGWIEVDNQKYYAQLDGQLVTGIVQIDSNYYYFNSEGKLQTGWIEVNDQKYYAKSNGELAIGKVKVSKNYYYFNSIGELQTGWIKADNQKYYANSSGELAIGKVKVSKNYYYFNSIGELQTGWIKTSNQKYYAKTSGELAVGKVKIGKNYYYFKTTGELQTGWIKVSDQKYYANSNGVLQTGLKKISNKYYFFNSSGKLTHNLGQKFNSKLYNKLISNGESKNYALNYVLHPSILTNHYKNIHTISKQSSITALVNKNYRLSSTYKPKDLVLLDVPLYNPGSKNMSNYLRKEAATALKKMFAAAKSEKGYKLVARSGYRSYQTQRTLYSRYVSQNGKVWADKYSARAGHSEHQTGLAIDITSKSVNNQLSEKFGSTPEGKWLAKNAHKFGFILRYPKGRVSEVGFEYEPWHFRYVGVKVATDIYKKGWIYEEYILENGLIPATK